MRARGRPGCPSLPTPSPPASFFLTSSLPPGQDSRAPLATSESARCCAPGCVRPPGHPVSLVTIVRQERTSLSLELREADMACSGPEEPDADQDEVGPAW